MIQPRIQNPVLVLELRFNKSAVEPLLPGGTWWNCWVEIKYLCIRNKDYENWYEYGTSSATTCRRCYSTRTVP